MAGVAGAATLRFFVEAFVCLCCRQCACMLLLVLSPQRRKDHEAALENVGDGQGDGRDKLEYVELGEPLEVEHDQRQAQDQMHFALPLRRRR